KDAVLYKRLSEPSTLPVAQISPASLDRISKADRDSPDGVTLTYNAVVELDQRPMRTLEARIVGRERPEECTVSVAHIQEPGASDNASGVGGQLEAAIATAKILKAGMIRWPSRSIAFVWGDEYTQTEIWLEDTKLIPVAGISSDMMGNSPELTGSICLLERMPDPGGVMPLAPDVHTPWGAGEVTGKMVKPNGFAIVARCAMIDVALYTREMNAAGTAPEVTWQTADHPWEGGSDHDVFNAAGIPGVLIWHFTDFTYHTSLDRMNMVDGMELKRAEVVLASTLLALADPEPRDLNRYLISLGHEMITRTSAAEDAGKPGLIAAWRQWERGASAWLRAECLGISADEALTAATAAERASDEAAAAFYAAQAL
ncbi:MAG: aminopeptidase YwaD, partial [Planctomycetota bacterium]